MKKILSFLLFIFISGQILKGQSYFHQYTPVETPQIEQSNPLIEYMQYMRQRDIESQFEKEQEQHYRSCTSGENRLRQKNLYWRSGTYRRNYDART